MQHIGTVYLSRQRPLASITSSGSFELQLAVYDRIHSRAVEPWRLIWAGPAAQAFWAAHQAQLLPGAALHVTCENARAHTIARSRLPITEIQAHIVQAQLHSPAGDGA